MIYFFCHHGDYEFADSLKRIIKEKRFDDFMELFNRNPQDDRFSEYISDDEGNDYPVWIKENFMKIDIVDFEHG